MINGLNRTKMMQEAKAQSKPKTVMFEFLVFILLTFVISFAQSLVITPATVIYLFSDEKILNLLVSGQDKYEELMTRVLEMSQAQPDWLMVVTLFSTIVMTLCTCIYCRCIEKRKLSSMGFRKHGAFLEYIKGLFVGLVLITLVYLILYLLGIVKIDKFNSISIPMIIAYFFAYLIQGMAEEVLIHGYFMTSLTKSTSVISAMVLSSAMFSLLHFANTGLTLISVINLFMFGMLTSMYMVKRGNIWGICAIHSIWNFVQGNVLGISVSGTSKTESIISSSFTSEVSNLTGGDFGIEGSLITTLVLFLAIGLVLLIKQNPNEIALEEKE